jgi:Di- and tricarboxylate transporters
MVSTAGYGSLALLVLLVGMLVLFALDRVRMEVVALGGLALGVTFGLVSPTGAFAGLASPAFVTVVEILLIVQVLGRSGVLDPLARRIPQAARSPIGIMALLTGITAALSVFMNNIGALALMLPVVSSVCRVAGLDQRRVLMPVSFAALLGGLCSIIGTPANLIVNEQLIAATGRHFAFFDYAYVGLPAALTGLAMILFLWRGSLTAAPAPDGRLPPQHLRTVIAEMRVPAGSELSGAAVADLGLELHALRRAGAPIIFQRSGTRFEPRDLVLVSGSFTAIEALVASGALEFATARSSGDRIRVEAVIMPESPLVGSRVGLVESLRSREIDIVAVAGQAPRPEGGFGDIRLAIGDVLHLSGERQALAEAAEEAEILPLWPRETQAAPERRPFPAIAFGLGVIAAALGLLAPEHAFGLVVIALAAAGHLNLRKGLGEIDWPILIMLAALIPLGGAVETTGAAATLAGALTAFAPADVPLALPAIMLFLAIAITPFVNNASTAIVLGPVAIGLAQTAGIAPEPLLIAVALGASIDFLTPIGHHNNTIVMGLAGYRFADFLKAGWPLTLAVGLVSIIAIGLWWL